MYIRVSRGSWDNEMLIWWYDHVAAVLGLSLTALQMFFFLMFLTTVGISSTRDIRDAWHAGWWPVKTILWITLIAAPFLIPPQYIEIYGVFPSIIFMHKLCRTCSICRFWRTSKDIDSIEYVFLWAMADSEDTCFVCCAGEVARYGAGYFPKQLQ